MLRLRWLPLTLLLAAGLCRCTVKGFILCKNSLVFGETHTLSVNINSPTSVCYQLDSSTENAALRVFAECEDPAAKWHPVLVTVRQPKGVTSWPIPFVESGYAHTSLHRTLCPLLNIDEVPGESSILVDLSTSSTHFLNFTLRVSVVTPYKLQLNKPEELVASPSSPSYLLFEYPRNQASVRVRVTSDEETRERCAIASIQNVYCPVVELLDNPEDRGKYQTMKSLAAFSVEKEGSRYGFFYVVLSVYPHNGPYDDCDYTVPEFVETISLSQCTMHNYNAARNSSSQGAKRVSVTVEPSLPRERYYLVVGLTLGFFLLFYFIVFFWITFFEWWKYDSHEMYRSLRRAASVVAEDLAAPFDDFDGGIARLVAPRPPLNTASSLRKRPRNTNHSQDGVQAAGLRPPSYNNGAERQLETRPSLESTESLEEEQEIPRPADQSPEPESQAMARPTLLSVLAGVHWKSITQRAVEARLRRPDSVSSEQPPLRVAGGPPFPSTSPTPSQQFGIQGDSQSTNPDNDEWEVGEAGSDTSVSIEMEYKYDTPTFPVKVLLSELGGLDEHQRAFDYYPVYLLVVGTFYILPVFQLLITYRQVVAMGNEDICYHNFLCSHEVEVWGLTLSAFNNLFSNIGFFSLGFLLILIVYRRRQMYRCLVSVNLPRLRAKKRGIPQQFGIYYAIGVAMMGQAILSTGYHMCPTKDNFRFDATFMYVQTLLGIHKLLQSRVPDKSLGLHESMLVLTTLMVTVVIGMISSTSLTFWLLFFAAYVVVTVIFSVENYYRWQLSLKWAGLKKLLTFYQSEGIFPPRHRPKFTLAVIIILVNSAFALYGLFFRPSKFALYMTFILLSNFLAHLLYYMLTKLVYRELRCSNHPKALLFAGLAVLFWVIGVVFFAMDPTEWNVSPSLSRDQNQDCLVMGFYDSHDIWHFFSGFAMFFSSMLLMTLDDKQEVWTRDNIMTF